MNGLQKIIWAQWEQVKNDPEKARQWIDDIDWTEKVVKEIKMREWESYESEVHEKIIEWGCLGQYAVDYGLEYDEWSWVQMMIESAPDLNAKGRPIENVYEEKLMYGGRDKKWHDALINRIWKGQKNAWNGLKVLEESFLKRENWKKKLGYHWHGQSLLPSWELADEEWIKIIDWTLDWKSDKCWINERYKEGQEALHRENNIVESIDDVIRFRLEGNEEKKQCLGFNHGFSELSAAWLKSELGQNKCKAWALDCLHRNQNEGIWKIIKDYLPQEWSFFDAKTGFENRREEQARLILKVGYKPAVCIREKQELVHDLIFMTHQCPQALELEKQWWKNDSALGQWERMKQKTLILMGFRWALDHYEEWKDKKELKEKIKINPEAMEKAWDDYFMHWKECLMETPDVAAGLWMVLEMAPIAEEIKSQEDWGNTWSHLFKQTWNEVLEEHQKKGADQSLKIRKDIEDHIQSTWQSCIHGLTSKKTSNQENKERAERVLDLGFHWTQGIPKMESWIGEGIKEDMIRSAWEKKVMEKTMKENESVNKKKIKL